jgi:hypothetical protein
MHHGIRIVERADYERLIGLIERFVHETVGPSHVLSLPTPGHGTSTLRNTRMSPSP